MGAYQTQGVGPAPRSSGSITNAVRPATVRVVPVRGSAFLARRGSFAGTSGRRSSSRASIHTLRKETGLLCPCSLSGSGSGPSGLPAPVFRDSATASCTSRSLWKRVRRASSVFVPPSKRAARKSRS